MKWASWCAVLVWGVLPQLAWAQNQGTTSVQLPTFGFVTVATTVSVPDGGRTFLGGINRASSGRNEFGMPLSPFPNNRAIGSERSAQSMSVTATIIDMRELDAAVLGQSNYVMRPAPELAKIRQLAEAQNSNAGQGDTSLAAIKAGLSQKKNAEQQEAWLSFEKGLAAEEAGKLSSANVYYQMALRRASGELKSLAESRLAAISNPTSARVASRP